MRGVNDVKDQDHLREASPVVRRRCGEWGGRRRRVRVRLEVHQRTRQNDLRGEAAETGDPRRDRHRAHLERSRAIAAGADNRHIAFAADMILVA